MYRLALGATLAVALAASMGGPALGAVTQNASIPYTAVVSVPCAHDGVGDLVLLTGRLHVVTGATESGTGTSGFVHFQPQDVAGVSLWDGTSYRATGVTRSGGAASGAGDRSQFTDVTVWHLVGRGAAADVFVQQVWHVTVSAAGIISSQVAHSVVSCR